MTSLVLVRTRKRLGSSDILGYFLTDANYFLTMEHIKRVKNIHIQEGGEIHSGWLPKNAAVPLPTPVKHYLIDVEIISEGDGYLLCYSTAQRDYRGDFWFQTIEAAEDAALEWFGIDKTQWNDL